MLVHIGLDCAYLLWLPNKTKIQLCVCLEPVSYWFGPPLFAAKIHTNQHALVWILVITASGKAVVDPIQKSRGVNDILDSLQMNRTTTMKQVMGRVESEGSNDRLSVLYSKLRTSGSSARRRGGSPIRRGQSTSDVPATPKTSSRLLARLKANSSMKKAATESDL